MRRVERDLDAPVVLVRPEAHGRQSTNAVQLATGHVGIGGDWPAGVDQGASVVTVVVGRESGARRRARHRSGSPASARSGCCSVVGDVVERIDLGLQRHLKLPAMSPGCRRLDRVELATRRRRRGGRSTCSSWWCRSAAACRAARVRSSPHAAPTATSRREAGRQQGQRRSSIGRRMRRRSDRH